MSQRELFVVLVPICACLRGTAGLPQLYLVKDLLPPPISLAVCGLTPTPDQDGNAVEVHVHRLL